MIVWKGFLFLLKCLGILLLVLLGLLLLGVLLVLLAPVRYRGCVKKNEEPEESFIADGLISWLNPFVRVRIQYVEKKLRYTVRVFGFCLLNSEKPKKEKPQKEKTKKEKSQKEKPKKSKKKRETGECVNPVVEQKPNPAEGRREQSDTGKTECPAQTEAVKETEEPAAETAETEKKGSFFAKLMNFFERLAAIPGKIKQKIVHIGKTGKLLWYKKEMVASFLQDEMHLLALGKGWNTIKKVFRHILPRKLKGHAEFGTGDPESTGKALAVLGILYAAYGKNLTIVPIFYEKCLVAELTFKGRIRFGTLLVMGLRLIRDKQVKRFYRNLKKLIKKWEQKAE